MKEKTYVVTLKAGSYSIKECVPESTLRAIQSAFQTKQVFLYDNELWNLGEFKLMRWEAGKLKEGERSSTV